MQIIRNCLLAILILVLPLSTEAAGKQNSLYGQFLTNLDAVEASVIQSPAALAGGYFESLPSSNASYLNPLPGAVLTSSFGARVNPITNRYSFHEGVDLAGNFGDPVRAARSGTVTYAGWLEGYGYTVIIEHGQGITTLYGHNSSLSVNIGQNVRAGQTIASVGSTGQSTGPHVHFEIRKNNEAINPLSYI